MDELDALQSAIGYTFADRSLLVQALTHPSYLGEHKEQSSNQRMEYLGDAVLELAVSTYLYSRLPAKAEGELSRIRAAIVSEQPLSVAAREIDLGRYLYLSQGERAGGGAEKASILSDALEAVFGAIYLDSGFEPACAAVLRLMDARMEDITAHCGEAVDHKSRLQELVQQHGAARIEYREEEQHGPAHDRSYTFSVWINGKMCGSGSGKTKRPHSRRPQAAPLICLQSPKSLNGTLTKAVFGANTAHIMHFFLPADLQSRREALFFGF